MQRMAKKKGKTPASAESPDESGRRQVSIDDDLVKKIGLIITQINMNVTGRKVTVPDWVNNHLRPIVEEEYEISRRKLGVPSDD